MPPVSESLSKPVAAPERSLVQRMEALQRANDIRSRRAQLKRDLKAGRQPIHELLLDPPDYLETAKVFDLLLAVPKYGRVKVNKILSQCRISPSKTIGGLSERQRGELVDADASALSAPACAAPPVARGVRDHRPIGGRQGDADPRAAGAGPGARAVGFGDHPRAAAGRAWTGSTTTS